MALFAHAGLSRADTASSPGPNPAAESLTQVLVALHARYLASPAERSRLASQLLTAAATRYQLLASLIEDNPGEVLRVALPATLRAALPSAVQAYIEEEVEAEGVLEVLHEDRHTGSRYLYFLDTAAERLSLHFAADPPELLTGARVRVRGVRVNGALALGSSKGSVQTLSSALPNAVGEQRTLVILVNFSDEPSQPYTPEEAQSVVFNTTSQFYLENSFEQTWLTGDVVGWFTIALSSTVCDPNALAVQAQAAASAAGVNLAAYARYVYAFSTIGCTGRGWGTVGGNPSQTWINGSLDLAVVGHEMGHNLGLYHSHSMECGTAVVGSSCTIMEYGDPFDVMGNSSPGHFSAFQKERLGWLNAGASPAITTVQSDGTYTLEAYEALGTGPKALKILKSIDPTTGQKTWYYVEYRQAIGFDEFLATNANVLSGVLVHTGSESSANSSYLLDMTPASGILNVYDWRDPALGVGLTFQDPESGLTVTTDWVTGTEAAVTVGSATTVTDSTVAVAVSTDQPSYALRQTVSITATVRSGGSPVADVSVSFRIIEPTGDVTSATATTGTDGIAVYKFRLKRQDPVGIYQVGATATSMAASGSAATQFTVR